MIYLHEDGSTYHGTLTKRMQDAFETEAKRTGTTVGIVLWTALREAMHRIEQRQAPVTKQCKHLHLTWVAPNPGKSDYYRCDACGVTWTLDMFGELWKDQARARGERIFSDEQPPAR